MTNPVQFHILTASYNRPELLKRCYDHLKKQQGHWQWWVGDDASTQFDQVLWEQLNHDPRVHNIRFEDNGGCNRTRNRLLENILQSGIKGYVMILDDDDYLVEDALLKLTTAIEQQPENLWYVSHCVYPTGGRLGTIHSTKTQLNYVDDYMLQRQFKGDFTHCLHTDVIGSARFTEAFKNSEEWYFFVDVAQRCSMTLLDIDTKILEYLPDGLTQKGFNREYPLKVQQLKVERLKAYLTPEQLAPYQLKLAKLQLSQGLKAEAKHSLRETQAATCHQRFKKWVLTQKSRF